MGNYSERNHVVVMIISLLIIEVNMNLDLVGVHNIIVFHMDQVILVILAMLVKVPKLLVNLIVNTVVA